MDKKCRCKSCADKKCPGRHLNYPGASYDCWTDKQPVDDGPTNHERAEWARRALDVFQQAKGEQIEFTEDEVSDLITDLLHCTDLQLGVRPEDMIKRALNNFYAERG